MNYVIYNTDDFMRIEHHLKKFRRFENTISKLDFNEDYETIIEDLMLAASHLINAAMHKLDKLKIDKDIKHNLLYGFLINENPLNEKSGEVAEFIQGIEQLRPSHVYGKGENGKTAKEAKKLFEAIKKICFDILGVNNERESPESC